MYLTIQSSWPPSQEKSSGRNGEPCPNNIDNSSSHSRKCCPIPWISSGQETKVWRWSGFWKRKWVFDTDKEKDVALTNCTLVLSNLPGPDMKHQGNSNGNREVRESAAAAAAMLAANGYSAAFPFLQHFANASNSNSAQHQQQQQQLAAAAAALGLPGLPSSRYESVEKHMKSKTFALLSLQCLSFRSIHFRSVDLCSAE